MSAPSPHRGQPVLRAGHALEGARAAAILLHGRGGSAEDMLGFAEALRGLGAEVTEKIYPGMGHVVCDDELDWARERMHQLAAPVAR